MIRAANASDTPAICRMIRALAQYEKLSDQVKLDPDLLRDHLFGETPFAEVLVVEDGGAPAGEAGNVSGGTLVGFALFFHNYSTFLGKPGIYLEDLYVEPEHRRKGHGRALLMGVAKLAVDRGCGRLDWSVLNWNEPSIGFYKSLGAAPVDGWTTYRLTGDALTAAGKTMARRR